MKAQLRPLMKKALEELISGKTTGLRMKIESSNLKAFLKEFQEAQFAKFKSVEHKHRGNSVTDDEVDWMTFDWAAIENHFWEEVEEYRIANPDDRHKELIDVANMAFLLWVKETVDSAKAEGKE